MDSCWETLWTLCALSLQEANCACRLLGDALPYTPDGAGLRGSASSRRAAVPSLQRLCERSVAQRLVELRTVLQVMEYADAAGAEVLKQYCMAVSFASLLACSTCVLVGDPQFM